MFRFRPPENDNLFEFVGKLELPTKDEQNKITIIFPSDGQEYEDFNDSILNLVFPLPNNVFIKKGDKTWINLLENQVINDLPQTLFIYIHYHFNESVLEAYFLVSKYLHPKLLTKLVELAPTENANNIFSQYRNIPFKATPYDVVCENCPEPVIQKQGFSGQCETTYFLNFFLSNYPPFYICIFIYFLFLKQKVAIVSSSFELASKTVLSILTFLYPIELSCVGIPLLSLKDLSPLQTKDPIVIGIHSSALLQLYSDNAFKDFIIFNADDPYIFSRASNKHLFTSKITELITTFHDNVTSLCIAQKPIFPGIFILKEIDIFVVNMLKEVCNATQTDYESIKYDWNKGVNLFCKSDVMKSLIDQASETSANREARNAFWPESDEYGRNYKNVRRVPNPPKTKYEITSKKKKDKKK
ncbi:hypothetical protein GPJ56_005338 [Histomonas meleagridis]|uniref:uncharacterized protein n=1 Tax=Histomonas meleagridis TaxID=135588 RepID=UPI0035597FC3|nr:hypothetical protein GPJ56_005338 [Histomonas meleagridis]KAH0796318.1 hypothetical protein GO595_010211 [Histomonas meleagridis]